MTRLVILAEERSGDHLSRRESASTPEYATTHREVVTASGGGIDIGSVYLDGRRSEHAFPFRITFRLDFDLAQINRHTDFISNCLHHCLYRLMVWTALEVDNSDLHVLGLSCSFEHRRECLHRRVKPIVCFGCPALRQAEAKLIFDNSDRHPVECGLDGCDLRKKIVGTPLFFNHASNRTDMPFDTAQGIAQRPDLWLVQVGASARL